MKEDSAAPVGPLARERLPIGASWYYASHAMAVRSDVPFNPKMFRWAREWRHRSVADVARKFKKTPAEIEGWETGASAPTVRQARMLAEFLGRPFLEFFLDQPPEIPRPSEIADFRYYRDAEPLAPDDLREIQSWAEEQRLNALDLFALLGEEPPTVPDVLHFGIADRADVAAAMARAAIGFPIEEQLSLGARDDMARLVRRRLEAAGILTLKRSELAEHRARGLCLAIFPLPVIVFASEAPTAQSFTLAHEFGHVVLRLSAVSPTATPREAASDPRSIEAWCDRFAGAFLIPLDALRRTLAAPPSPLEAISDDLLASLANHFKVSPHAMLVRLVQASYVKSEYYWNVKRDQFVQQEREYRSFGRAKYYGTRYRSRQGDLYTSLVLDAWASGAINNHNAAEFMGIKNFRHLNDVRDWFSQA